MSKPIETTGSMVNYFFSSEKADDFVPHLFLFLESKDQKSLSVINKKCNEIGKKLFEMIFRMDISRGFDEFCFIKDVCGSVNDFGDFLREPSVESGCQSIFFQELFRVQEEFEDLFIDKRLGRAFDLAVTISNPTLKEIALKEIISAADPKRELSEPNPEQITWGPLGPVSTQKKIEGFFYKIKNRDGITRGYILGACHDAALLGMKLNNHKIIEKKFDKSQYAVCELDVYEETLKKHEKGAESIFEEGFKEGRFGFMTEEEKIQSKAEFVAYNNERLQEQLKNESSTRQDLHFVLRAKNEGKRIYELETFEFQKAVLEAHEQEATDLVKLKLAPILQQNPSEFAPLIIAVYTSITNIPCKQFVREAIQESSEQKFKMAQKFGPPVSKEMKTRMWSKRNELMAEKTDALLRKEVGLFFIFPGLGHVVGKKGVPSLLSKQYGWTIEKLSG